MPAHQCLWATLCLLIVGPPDFPRLTKGTSPSGVPAGLPHPQVHLELPPKVSNMAAGTGIVTILDDKDTDRHLINACMTRTSELPRERIPSPLKAVVGQVARAAQLGISEHRNLTLCTSVTPKATQQHLDLSKLGDSNQETPMCRTVKG